MIPIKLAVQAIGTLFPVIFPKQEFKPKRLIAAVLVTALAATSINFIGLENTEAALEVAEEVLELSEEEQ